MDDVVEALRHPDLPSEEWDAGPVCLEGGQDIRFICWPISTPEQLRACRWRSSGLPARAVADNAYDPQGKPGGIIPVPNLNARGRAFFILQQIETPSARASTQPCALA